jgi:peptidoglycan hydrolase-like protein with peptidoglycan-binding domain
MLTPRLLRLGLAAFTVLTGALVANLFLLQPTNERVAANAERAAPFTMAQPASEMSPGPVQQAERAEGDSIGLVRAVQRELAGRGYEPGSADGVAGLVTRAAIMAYEWDHGMALSGEPSEELLRRVLLGSSELETASLPGSGAIGPRAEQVIRTVQQSLLNLGLKPGAVTGRMSDETVRAIRDFEAKQGLPVTGRISGPLVARMARLAGQGRFADNHR